MKLFNLLEHIDPIRYAYRWLYALIPLAIINLVYRGVVLVGIYNRPVDNLPNDFELRLIEVQHFVRGLPIYELLNSAVYPPASYVLLRPIGWIENHGLLFLAYVIFQLLAMICAALLIIRIFPQLGYLAPALLIANEGLGKTISDGQLGILLIAVLLAVIHRVERSGGTWKDSLLIAVLFNVSLIKPTFSAPFFFIVLLAKNSWRVFLLSGTLYGALTLWASYTQQIMPVQLFSDWLEVALSGTRFSASVTHANITSLFAKSPFATISPIFSILVLLFLAAFVLRYRRANVWYLAGMAAFVSRFWTYHRAYDNVVLILLLFALLLGCATVPRRTRLRAVLTLLCLLLTLTLIPRLSGQMPILLRFLTDQIAFLIWIAAAIGVGVLVQRSHRQNIYLATRPFRIPSTSAPSHEIDVNAAGIAISKTHARNRKVISER